MRDLEYRAAKIARRLISDWSWGTDKKFREYTNDWMNCHLLGMTKYFVAPPPQYKILDHFNNKCTLYVCGRSKGQIKKNGVWKNPSKHYSLAALDVDCHETGDLNGALAFNEFIKNQYFKKMKYEPSTHGKGSHGYLIIDRTNLKDNEYNDLLKKLDKWLKEIQIINNFNISDVEIKGHCPELKWEDKVNKYQIHKAGVLVKFPRSADTLNTQVITAEEIQRIIDIPLNLPSTYLMGGNKNEKNKKKSGSNWGGCPIHRQIINDLLPLANHFMPQNISANVKNKVNVVSEDLAISMSIIYFVTEHMNEDGSFPTNRAKAIWDIAYTNGITNRAWDHKRWKVCRDLLSKNNLLEINDSSYTIGYKDENGKNKGVACKWQGNQEFMDMCSSFIESKVTPSTYLMGGEIKIDQWIEENRENLPFRPVLAAIEMPYKLIYDDSLEEKLMRIMKPNKEIGIAA